MANGTLIKLEYYGFAGEGPTVKAAKENAGQRIREAMEGNYSPSIIRWREYTVLMWREPKMGWGYKISHPEVQGTTIQERMWQCSNHGHDEDETLRSLVKHIADIARPTGEDPALSKPLFDLCRHARDIERDYRDFRVNCQRNDVFQLRFRHAERELGMGNGDAHDWAGMNPSRYGLWKGTEALIQVPTWPEVGNG